MGHSVWKSTINVSFYNSKVTFGVIFKLSDCLQGDEVKKEKIEEVCADPHGVWPPRLLRLKLLLHCKPLEEDFWGSPHVTSAQAIEEGLQRYRVTVFFQFILEVEPIENSLEILWFSGCYSRLAFTASEVGRGRGLRSNIQSTPEVIFVRAPYWTTTRWLNEDDGQIGFCKRLRKVSPRPRHSRNKQQFQ